MTDSRTTTVGATTPYGARSRTADILPSEREGVDGLACAKHEALVVLVPLPTPRATTVAYATSSFCQARAPLSSPNSIEELAQLKWTSQVSEYKCDGLAMRAIRSRPDTALVGALEQRLLLFILILAHQGPSSASDARP